MYKNTTIYKPTFRVNFFQSSQMYALAILDLGLNKKSLSRPTT